MAAAIIGGILLGALLTAIHAGLNALGEVGLQAIGEADGPDANVARRALAQRQAISARLLVGRVLSVTLAAAVGAFWCFERAGLAPALGAVILVALVYSAAASISTTIVRRLAGRVVLKLLKWSAPVELLLAPIAVPLAWLAKLVERLVPESTEDDTERVTELAVEQVIGQGEETGSIAQDHAQMLRSVLEFKNTVAREIMISRTRIVAFEITTPVAEVIKQVIESEHSRYPVYRGQPDQIEGILYAKDLFQVLSSQTEASDVRLRDLMRRSAFFVAETQKIGVLLREMQRRRLHLAVVVDEFGGLAGIVTLEDIVEEIVGEIHDEHDEELPRVTEKSRGRYVADASISVYDLEEILGEPIIDDKSNFDTLGGLIVEIAGRVPEVGESVHTDGFKLLILEADDRRVVKVELSKKREPDGAAGAKVAAG